MVAKVPDIAPTVDVLLANLEDAIPATEKENARAGLVEIAKNWDTPDTQLWTRINSLDSPWVLDDLVAAVTEAGDALDVIMVPKVEGPEDIHYVDRVLAQLEAKAGLDRPILVHAILETARGVANVEEICAASPRMQGLSLGPADLGANRRMKTTRVGGGHPGYLVRADPNPDDPDAPRPTYQQDLWHYTIARMVDACVTYGVLPYYGPFGDIADTTACEDQFRNAYLLGCVGAWSLHPVQVDIAKRVFSPPPADVEHARRGHRRDGRRPNGRRLQRALQIRIELNGQRCAHPHPYELHVRHVERHGCKQRAAGNHGDRLPDRRQAIAKEQQHGARDRVHMHHEPTHEPQKTTLEKEGRTVEMRHLAAGKSLKRLVALRNPPGRLGDVLEEIAGGP